MPTVSLIVPTFGRTAEIDHLFASLALQDLSTLECIVVDQNPDDRLAPILARWGNSFHIRHLRAPRGVSRARNLGLRHATGDIVAFPDDDCWYSPALLRHVIDWFEQNPGFNILTVGAQDHDGTPSGNRWPQDRCELRPVNIFRTTFCSSIFLRRSAALNTALEAARFDETIGPGAGTPIGCGEETDFVLHLLQHGGRGFFDRSLTVGHPVRDMLSGTVDRRRAAGYGYGYGYVLRKHSLTLLAVAFVAYDFLRLALVALKGDTESAALCFHHGCGIAAGYLNRTLPKPAHA